MTVQHSDIEPRVRILAESERLFRHYGYAKTTMADIAEACQMSPANLYRFFESKSALVKAICGKITTDIETRLVQIVRTEASAAQRIEWFIQECHRHTLENLLDHRKVHEMVVIAMEEQWDTVKAHLGRVRAYMQRIIEDGMASGEFPVKDAEFASRCVHAATAYLCHPVIVAQKLDDENRVPPAEMAKFLVRALKTPPE